MVLGLFVVLSASSKLLDGNKNHTHGEAGRGKARHGKARLGMAGQGEAFFFKKFRTRPLLYNSH